MNEAFLWIYGVKSKYDAGRGENSFWALDEIGFSIQNIFGQQRSLETFSSERKSMTWHGIGQNVQRKLQNSRVFDGNSFFRMLAAPKLFFKNRIKSHDVWGSMTSGALFSREWKRSTRNKSEICLDYLSRAIPIQKKSFSVLENRWKTAVKSNLLSGSSGDLWEILQQSTKAVNLWSGEIDKLKSMNEANREKHKKLR